MPVSLQPVASAGEAQDHPGNASHLACEHELQPHPSGKSHSLTVGKTWRSKVAKKHQRTVQKARTPRLLSGPYASQSQCSNTLWKLVHTCLEINNITGQVSQLLMIYHTISPPPCIAERPVILIHRKQLTLSDVAPRHCSLPDVETIIL